MSYQTFNAGAAPSTPASGKVSLYTDSADRRVKQLDQYGTTANLTDDFHLNYITNGGFWFAQRQAPGTATTYSSVGGRAYTADRWWVSNENASVTYARVDTGAAPETGIRNRFYGQFVKTTATGKIVVGQALEGTDSCNLRGRRVRFVCMLKADSARTFRVGVIQLTSAGTQDTIPSGAGLYITAFGANGVDPTLGTNLSYIAPVAGITYPNGTVSGNAVSCSVTTSWQQFSVVVDIPSTAKNVIVSVWSDSQVTLTTGSLSITECTMADDQSLSDWSPRNINMEAHRCFRFYCKTFGIDQNPTTNVGLNTGEHKWVKVAAGATASRSPEWRFPTEMRGTPTVTTFNPAAANAQVRDETGALDTTATATVSGLSTSVAVTCTGNAGTAAENLFGVHLSADAEL